MTEGLCSSAWHAAEDAQERAWLDDWMRGRICPICLTACPRTVPELGSVPPLATTGRP